MSIIGADEVPPPITMATAVSGSESPKVTASEMAGMINLVLCIRAQKIPLLCVCLYNVVEAVVVGSGAPEEPMDVTPPPLPTTEEQLKSQEEGSGAEQDKVRVDMLSCREGMVGSCQKIIEMVGVAYTSLRFDEACVNITVLLITLGVHARELLYSSCVSVSNLTPSYDICTTN